MEQIIRMARYTKGTDTSSLQDLPNSTRQGYATSRDGSGRQFGSIPMSLSFSTTPHQTSFGTGMGTTYQEEPRTTSPFRHTPPERSGIATSPSSAVSSSMQAKYLPCYLGEEEARFEVLVGLPHRLDTALDKKRALFGAEGPTNALPCAISAAHIEDINSIAYPDGIQRPSAKLNKYSKHGMFRYVLLSCIIGDSNLKLLYRYDRAFLLQFMSICKDKPDTLPPLYVIGLEPFDQNYAMARGGSGRRGGFAMGPLSSTTPRQAAVGLGISEFKHANFNTGQLATEGSTNMSSEEQFAISPRLAHMPGSLARLPFRHPDVYPTAEPSVQSGSSSVPTGSKRARSKRGGRNIATQPSASASNAAVQGSMALDPVVPLEISANRWTSSSLAKEPQAVDDDLPVVVDRKVKSLLNKLTMHNFDSISGQIISWANKSEIDKDGRTLVQVIRLVFEQVIDDAACPIYMYARLCRKMMERISPTLQDDKVRSSEGKHITGSRLFRKYLLSHCKEDFERGWALQGPTANTDVSDTGMLYSYEYCKTKRRALGSVKFIGELFKLQMLTESIMHEYARKLLGNVDNSEEQEIEKLCKLLTTVIALLDSPKARAHIDVYFSRMKELTNSPNVNSRMRFMLQVMQVVMHTMGISDVIHRM